MRASENITQEHISMEWKYAEKSFYCGICAKSFHETFSSLDSFQRSFDINFISQTFLNVMSLNVIGKIFASSLLHRTFRIVSRNAAVAAYSSDKPARNIFSHFVRNHEK